MTRIKIISMALVAMFCVSAFGVANASALNTKGEGTKEGRIVTTKGKEPTNAVFVGTSEAAGLLETVAGSKIECAKTVVNGTITSSTTGSATFVFTECIQAIGKCKTSKAASGEIVVPVTLSGTTTANKQNDLVLNTVALFDIKCGSEDIKIAGSILVKVLTEGILSTEQQFQAKGAAGVQAPEETTNKLQASFGGKTFEPASINSGVLKVHFSESVDAI